MASLIEKIKKIKLNSSFLIGFGSILDISGGHSHMYESITNVSDAEALRRDWMVVGGDFIKVMNENPINQIKK